MAAPDNQANVERKKSYTENQLSYVEEHKIDSSQSHTDSFRNSTEEAEIVTLQSDSLKRQEEPSTLQPKVPDSLVLETEEEGNYIVSSIPDIDQEDSCGQVSEDNQSNSRIYQRYPEVTTADQLEIDEEYSIPSSFPELEEKWSCLFL